MAVEVYRVMFVNQVAVNAIYIYTLAWILKCLKLYPSISLIDDSAAATQPLSRCARVADAATQPLCQSGWSSQSATQPLCQSGRRSHSATLPERLEEQPLRHSATQPLCRSGWRSSHSATQLLCQSGWSSHSATLPEWLEQPLSHSVTLPEWLEQPLSHSVTLPEWLEQPLSHSVTQSGWVAEWLRQPLCQSGWVAEWLMWKFPPLRVQSIYIHTHTHICIYIYICIDRYRYRGNNNGLSFQFCQTSIHWYFVEAWKKSTSTGSMHAMNIHCFQSFGRLVWSPQPIFHQIFVAMQDAIHVSNTVSFCPLEWEVTHPQPNSEFPTSVIFW